MRSITVTRTATRGGCCCFHKILYRLVENMCILTMIMNSSISYNCILVVETLQCLWKRGLKESFLLVIKQKAYLMVSYVYCFRCLCCICVMDSVAVAVVDAVIHNVVGDGPIEFEYIGPLRRKGGLLFLGVIVYDCLWIGGTRCRMIESPIRAILL